MRELSLQPGLTPLASAGRLARTLGVIVATMPSSRPSSLTSAKSAVYAARRKRRAQLREASLAAEKACLAEENAREEARQLALRKAELESQRAIIARHAVKTAKVVVERCIQDALAGFHESRVRIEVESGGIALQNEVLNVTLSELSRSGLGATPTNVAGEYLISWRSIEWTRFTLRGAVSPAYLAWLSSASGQGLLHQIWTAIEGSAKSGRFAIVLGLSALEPNEDRWGKNEVQSVKRGAKAIGVLPVPTSNFMQLLKRQGYKCTAKAGRAASTTLTVSW